MIQLLLRLTHIDESYYEEHSKGQIINLLMNKSETVAVFTNKITHIIAQVCQAVILLVILFGIHWIIGVIALVAAVTCVLVKNYYINKESICSKHIIQKKDDMISSLGELITANYEVKSMNFFGKINQMVATQNEEKIALDNKKAIYNTSRSQLTPLVENVFQYIIMAIMIYFIYQQQSSIDVYIIVLGYYASLVVAFNENMDFISILKNNDISLTRLEEFLHYPENASQYFIGTKKLVSIQSLKFNNVSFHYQKRQTSLINHVDCVFDKGNITVITGSNGKGKSTIFKLISGLLKPCQGDIYLNDDLLYDFEYQDYISRISLVNQKPYFFNRSIEENLSYICEDKEKMVEACKKVGLHEFIMGLPEQYQTILSEDAINISGGQKQKLALARALLRDSEVLLLDEFTSSIDQQSIDTIYTLLEELKKDKIIIIITHKQAEIDKADTVYELKEGTMTKVMF